MLQVMYMSSTIQFELLNELSNVSSELQDVSSEFAELNKNIQALNKRIEHLIEVQSISLNAILIELRRFNDMHDKVCGSILYDEDE